MYTSDRDWKSYVNSDIWKCTQSPSKAHHWVGNGAQIQCKYCHNKQVVEYRCNWEINIERQRIANKNKKLRYL